MYPTVPVELVLLRGCGLEASCTTMPFRDMAYMKARIRLCQSWPTMHEGKETSTVNNQLCKHVHGTFSLWRSKKSSSGSNGLMRWIRAVKLVQPQKHPWSHWRITFISNMSIRLIQEIYWHNLTGYLMHRIRRNIWGQSFLRARARANYASTRLSYTTSVWGYRLPDSGYLLVIF